jgi:two-component system, NarL family, response regulator NreC
VSEATEGLTERELEVVRLLASGHTNREIAEQLYISRRTVEFHRANIRRKLGARSRAELTRHVRENGLA